MVSNNGTLTPDEEKKKQLALALAKQKALKMLFPKTLEIKE